MILIHIDRTFRRIKRNKDTAGTDYKGCRLLTGIFKQ
jgi:hypothetical protein